MKNLKLFKHSTLVVLALATTFGYSQKKYVESFNVSDNVEVSVNTSFTNVIFETWNKNKVEVEAFIEGDNLSESQKEQLMENWNLDIIGNSKKITVTSNAGKQPYALNEMPSLDFIG
ncbi:MAG: hypothetical protein KDC64_10945, partial [Aequorivita sp.]|nr:hypothetical protein [Aequorivita sp.]